MTSGEREAFEAWAFRELKQDARSWKHPSGEYVYLESEWKAWQARAALLGEGKELTTKQIEAGWHQTFSTSNPFCPCDLKTFTKAVRWAERAKSNGGN